MDNVEIIFNELKKKDPISKKTKLKKGNTYRSFFGTTYYNLEEIKGNDCIRFGLLHEEGHNRSHENRNWLILSVIILLIIIKLFTNQTRLYYFLTSYLFIIIFYYPVHYYIEYRCDLYAAKSMLSLKYDKNSVLSIMKKTLDQYPKHCIIIDYLIAHPTDEKRIEYVRKRI